MMDDINRDGVEITRQTDDGWSRYQMLVISELRRLDSNQKVLTREVAKVNTSVALLQLRAGFWGGVMGVLFGALAGAIFRKVLG